ncbi:MBL fold metallo-hydrolase [Aquifex pyrophilus]
MADPKRKLPGNAEGEFFVDSSCIDCSVCRQIAPEVFGDGKETAIVVKQPEVKEEYEKAFMALVSCPVSAIGTVSLKVPRHIYSYFPIKIAENVYLLGFSSKNSYGALSYLIVREEGNLMVDSPRYVKHLVEEIERLGGLKYIFLTHEDDVADADKYAKRFGAKRIIHLEDSHVMPDAEIKVEGYEPQKLEDFTIIPTPGHTKGHMVLLYEEKYLFTGDHVAYSRRRKKLVAFKEYCWYSWEKQKESIKKLLNFRFSWILPGHGYIKRITRKEFERFVEEILSL